MRRDARHGASLRGLSMTPETVCTRFCYDHQMMRPMTETIVLALLMLAMIGAAQAQQRTIYDASGRVAVRSAIDS
ncbi:hypothetical protein ABIF97_000428 [Bradyrhizobium japonicum]